LGIHFTWDPKKARRNLSKHGVSFEVAKETFFDPFVLVVEDSEIEDELRYQALGKSGSGLLIVAIFVDRSTDEREIIRIISARKAEQYEQRTYASQFQEGN